MKVRIIKDIERENLGIMPKGAIIEVEYNYGKQLIESGHVLEISEIEKAVKKQPIERAVADANKIINKIKN
jgi:vacuolar-type H+-ATPase subunit C/Vma6